MLTRSQPAQRVGRRVQRLVSLPRLIHTERAYCDWIKRYIRFHGMQSREDLRGGEKYIEAFLTHLAVHEQVAPSTQHQAMHALVFLYKQLLRHPLQDAINAVRAPKQLKVPVVMSREEVRTVIALMQGTPQRIVKVLYGCGVRVMEAVKVCLFPYPASGVTSTHIGRVPTV